MDVRDPCLSRALWITWHDHRRTKSIAACLRVPVHCHDRDDGVLRHLFGSLWAFWTLVRWRPRLVFLHHSYLLTATCVLYKKTFGRNRTTLIADCHNKALSRSMSGWRGRLFHGLKDWTLGNSDMIVVTNEQLTGLARRWCPEVAVLRDPLPVFPTVPADEDETGREFVFFICSFDRDEPLDFLFAAALAIVADTDLDVAISGNARRVQIPADVQAEDRIRFTGFVPENEYLRLLHRAAAIVVLTEEEGCLVCGAYEAVGAGRPLILSDTMALRQCFGGSAVFCEHEAEALLAALSEARQKENRSDHRERFQAAFDLEWERFLNQVGGLG